jgi:hypothetical protein
MPSVFLLKKGTEGFFCFSVNLGRTPGKEADMLDTHSSIYRRISSTNHRYASFLPTQMRSAKSAEKSAKSQF